MDFPEDWYMLLLQKEMYLQNIPNIEHVQV